MTDPDQRPLRDWAPPTGAPFGTDAPDDPRQPVYPGTRPTAPSTTALTDAREPDRADGSGSAGPDVVWPGAVADLEDPLDVAASPDAWLSPRALLILAVVSGAVLVVTVVVAWLLWSTPAAAPIPVPRVPQV
ncbi:hypothetical protein FHX74_001971 [Friedmanniella endophytica]|uniref:Uncharacterized protein n=1 Tax=Microlunatus kandeliicorticis TaxID=1759536 RepID=A0A7W3P5X6_9ACTN|nr:hypothetical protein [Microlunatus kandeliicorticis]MBA8794352.1 hypothetical protein [Microlunatus kandeliicorticis]